MFLDLHKICCLHLTFRGHVRVICDKWSKVFSSERRKKKKDEKRLTEIETEFLKILFVQLVLLLLLLLLGVQVKTC